MLQRSACVLVLAVFTSVSVAGDVSIRIAGWNLESNGNDSDISLLQDQIGDKDGIDIWGGRVPWVD